MGALANGIKVNGLETHCREHCRLMGLQGGIVVFAVTPRFFRLYGNRPSELETKFLLFCLLGMGALAGWADSEAVLPAYLIGMVLAGTVGKDHALIKRLRTLTFGLLTPFYFIRAGSFVSIPALVAAPAAFLCFLVLKIAAKIVGVYPITKLFGSSSARNASTIAASLAVECPRSLLHRLA
jgi:Kef-type K+ transport system membrane component KefB